MNAEAGQQWNPEHYATNARFVSDLGAPLLGLLGPCRGLRVLDLGCGDGALTARLREAGARVTGVDASPEMIAVARNLGLDARVMDAAELPFDSEFDAVFSNAALHWIPRAAEVIDGVWRALRNGGRFVGEFGGAGNVATILRALEAELWARGIEPPRPWFFPTPGDYAQRLEQRGFIARQIETFPRPTPLPGALADWLRTFSGPFAALVPHAAREQFIANVADACAPSLRDAQGAWHVDYVRLRFVAEKPGDQR